MGLPAYDVDRTYQWNYDHGPVLDDAAFTTEPPAVRGDFSLCGIRLNSPLGVAAGPLLNSRWISAYARLGFDFLTYKTVRTRARPCYDLPNWVFTDTRALGPADVAGGTLGVIPFDEARQRGPEMSSAVSFGMPSQSPDVWRADVSAAQAALADGQALVVSVVGSPQPGWGRDELADDFALAAGWAQQAGAHAVEANLSCPNVTSAEGGIFADPDLSADIARRCADAIDGIPLLLKVGFLPDDAKLAALLQAVNGIASGIVTLNTVSTDIVERDGTPAFGTPDRLHAGVTGRAVFPAAVDQVKRAATILARDRLSLQLIAVGGATSPENVRSFLDAGASLVEMATAPVFQPDIGFRVREALSANPTTGN
jgi:dihydroorotate dehydrogenase